MFGGIGYLTNKVLNSYKASVALRKYKWSNRSYIKAS
jgi:hypothetical protein